jgi:hypothetical protein
MFTYSVLLKNDREEEMENEEILILDGGDDSSISPQGFCCALTILPLRGI